MHINHFQHLTFGTTVHRYLQNMYEGKGHFSDQNLTFGCY